jgi:magnesium-transporting ATPase (P-type)
MILMREADMGILINTNFEMIDQKSVVYVKDVRYIVDAMQYSRNMVENIRKYIQFQLIVGVNLTIFILIGSFLYSTPPLSPS